MLTSYGKDTYRSKSKVDCTYKAFDAQCFFFSESSRTTTAHAEALDQGEHLGEKFGLRERGYLPLDPSPEGLSYSQYSSW